MKRQPANALASASLPFAPPVSKPKTPFSTSSTWPKRRPMARMISTSPWSGWKPTVLNRAPPDRSSPCESWFRSWYRTRAAGPCCPDWKYAPTSACRFSIGDQPTVPVKLEDELSVFSVATPVPEMRTVPFGGTAGASVSRVSRSSPWAETAEAVTRVRAARGRMARESPLHRGQASRPTEAE